MSSRCHNTPYAARDAVVLVANRRRLADILARDAASSYRGPVALPVFTPLQAFETLFGVHPHPFIIARVAACVARGHASQRYLQSHAPGAATTRPDRAGWVYVFWDAEEDPRGDALKIGSTSMQRRDAPAARVAQWRRELGHEDVRLLYAYATPRARWSEEIVHELLRCQRDRSRVNVITGHELTEFFFIDDHRALARLIHAVTLFVRVILRQH